MEDITTLIMAIAGFLHDTGKIADIDIMPLPAGYRESNAPLYQPVYRGNYSHEHALLTAGFIEAYGDRLPSQLTGWSQGPDSFVNLCGMHHKPETALQWIIAIADRLSAGFDRHSLEEEGNESIDPRRYRDTRLRPVLEELRLDRESDKAEPWTRRYHYPLKPLTAQSIFPLASDADHTRRGEDSRESYRQLFSDFVKELPDLYHRQENLALWFEHFDTLFMKYTANVPSARAGDVVPDVSLYDHARTTAALAAALYLYHRDTDTLQEDAIKKTDEDKFLLVTGDFYGIQEFILRGYGQTKTLRSKLLRGRSFTVSLFCELGADLVCRKLGLPFSSIILNAAGKFTIVAPNTPLSSMGVAEAENEINEWLLALSYGENSLGVSYKQLKPTDFTKERFRDAWEATKSSAEVKKYQRFDLNRHAGAVESYLRSFNNELAHPLCPLCGKRPSDRHVEQSELLGHVTSACRPCRDQVFLGTKLVRKARLAVVTTDADLKDPHNRLMEPIFGRYQLTFPTGRLNDLAKQNYLLRYWNLSLNEDGGISSGISAKLINGYVPTYTDDDQYDDRILAGEKSDERKMELIDGIAPGLPKTLEHIACKALNPSSDGGSPQGVAALGILKADIDHLGALMSYGLPKTSFTISRLATVSRQLDFFFSLHLPHFLATTPMYNDMYTVFAGGDDLFLIGPWNRIMNLVRDLRRDFARYVCHNTHVHFSAGIALSKAHTPLEQMAIEAEAALEASKSERNRLTIFGETMTYDDYDELISIRDVMMGWLEDEWINNAMLYRLNTLIDMAALERKLIGSVKPFALKELECTKWRSYLAYSADRNLAKGLTGDDRGRTSRSMAESIASWLERFGGKMNVPLWEILYNRR